MLKLVPHSTSNAAPVDQLPTGHTSPDPAMIDGTLQELTDFGTLEPLWLELQSRSDHSFFTSWNWIRTWLQHLPSQARPLLLTVTQHDVPLGVGILVIRNTWRRGLFHSKGLYLHETGLPGLDAVAIEHNGLLAARGYEHFVAQRALDMLLQTPHWNELHLSGLSRDNPLLAVIQCRQTRYRLNLLKSTPSPYVNLDTVRASQTDYLAALRSNTRQQIRRAVRAYKQFGPLELITACSVAEGQQFLSDLIVLHQRKWEAQGQSGAFKNPIFERFHRDLIHTSLPTGEAQLLRVNAGDHVLGYLYNFVHQSRVSFYQCGFDYSHPKLKPGLVSHYCAIEHYLRQGAREYDFLASDDQYKKSLSNAARSLVWAVYQRRSWSFDVERQLRAWKHRWLLHRKSIPTT